jgi:hypothetical protein
VRLVRVEYVDDDHAVVTHRHDAVASDVELLREN